MKPAARLAAVVLVATPLAGCSDGTDVPAPGGTLRYLLSQPSFTHLDPQRNFLVEDVAFASAFLQRTLTAYSADGDLVADLATDTGTASPDARTWTFTLRDGVTFDDGSPITCADVKFGVSRAFDPDVVAGSGLSRAVGLLDVAIGADGAPVYAGPYAAEPGDVAAFDRAVHCEDDQTITFRLARPAGDFDHAASALAFSPVPDGSEHAAEPGYDTTPVSSGPYRIEEYTAGERLVLVRNDEWHRESDPLRPAYPNRVEVRFSTDAAEVTQRLLADDGDDRDVVAARLDPATATEVANDSELAGRTVDGLDVGIRYIAVNTTVLPVLEHRQAVAAALDRAALHDALGGDLTGTPSDGLLPPNMTGSQPTGLWTQLLGTSIPETGDPERAQELVAASGTPLPALQLAYESGPTGDEAAAVVVTSLARADIDVQPRPFEPADYHLAIHDPANPFALMLSSWSPTWADPSTVVGELLTPRGTANLSRYDNPEFTARVEAASAELDAEARDSQWAALDAEAMADVAVVPLRFDHQLRLVGSAVRGAAIWAPYGALTFTDLWLESD